MKSLKIEYSPNSWPRMAANTVLGGALAVAIAMPALALEVTQGRLGEYRCRAAELA